MQHFQHQNIERQPEDKVAVVEGMLIQERKRQIGPNRIPLFRLPTERKEPRNLIQHNASTNPMPIRPRTEIASYNYSMWTQLLSGLQEGLP